MTVDFPPNRSCIFIKELWRCLGYSGWVFFQQALLSGLGAAVARLYGVRYLSQYIGNCYTISELMEEENGLVSE